MFEVLKIVHLLSLAIALGMTTANLITMRYAAEQPAEGRGVFGPLGRSFGAFGVMAVALLWVTGIALLLLRYDIAALDMWVLIKLGLVVVLTGMVISVRKIGAKAAQSGTPPPAGLMQTMMRAILALGVATVIAAVLAFN